MATSGSVPAFTHVSLSSGAKGFIVQESDDTVVVEDHNGKRQEYDKCSLHLVWARRDWGSQQ